MLGYVKPSETLQAARGGGRALRLGHTWEVAAREIEQLESCHWENAFEKVRNIFV